MRQSRREKKKRVKLIDSSSIRNTKSKIIGRLIKKEKYNGDKKNTGKENTEWKKGKKKKIKPGFQFRSNETIHHQPVVVNDFRLNDLINTFCFCPMRIIIVKSQILIYVGKCVRSIK